MVKYTVLIMTAKLRTGYSLISFMCVIFIITFFFRILVSVDLLPSDDDQYFLHALDGKSIFEFLHERYLTWSGRVPIEAVMVATIGIKIVWKLLIPTSAIVLSWAICRLSSHDVEVNKLHVCTVSLISICLIERSVFHDAALWVSGYYNYLLPISAASVSLVLFRKWTIPSLIAAVVLMSYSVSNEQISVLFFIFAAFLLTKSILERKLSIKEVLFILIPVISSIFWLSAPGNEVRFESEKNFFLEFTQFNILDKISHGFATYANHSLNGSNYLIFVLLLSIAYASWVDIKNGRKNGFIPVLIITSIMSMAFIINKISSIDMLFNNSTQNALTVESIGKLDTYFKYFISMIIAITIIYFSLISGFFRCGLYCVVGGMAVVVMVGLSPAIYAERPRVFFVSDVLLSFVFMKTVLFRFAQK